MTQGALELGGEPRAIFSSCGTYRYVLRREWSPGHQRACFVMLNPSTADAVDNDPTIRKCIGICWRQGWGGFSVVNLFAARSSKPSDLLLFADPIGPDNDRWIQREAENADRVIVAWGAHGEKWSRRVADVFALLAKCVDAPRLVSLALTESGQPWHPLMLAYDRVALAPWKPRPL